MVLKRLLQGRARTNVTGPGAATHLIVSCAGTATAGTGRLFTVTALDASNNTATGYTGTVHFTGTDTQETLPANASLTSGVGTFSYTMLTKGTQTITATDANVSSITGASNAITVAGLTATLLTWLPGYDLTEQAGFNLTATAAAVDIYGNVDTTKTNSVSVTSTDAQAELPASANLSSGQKAFSVTLKTAGNQNVIASASGLTAGTSSAIDVTHSILTTFTVENPDTVVNNVDNVLALTVTAVDAFGNTITNWGGTFDLEAGPDTDGGPGSYLVAQGTGPEAPIPATFPFTNGVFVGSFTINGFTVGQFRASDLGGDPIINPVDGQDMAVTP